MGLIKLTQQLIGWPLNPHLFRNCLASEMAERAPEQLLAAIYARYSSDLQSAASIEDQVRLCRQRIEREGWTLLANHVDHATRGASHLRPGFQALLEQGRAGGFDLW